MKKVILSAFVLALSCSLYSQIQRGQWLVGGSAGFESGKLGDFENTKFTSFELSPNAGYFFIDQFAGGARLSFQTTKFKGEDASTSLLFAPFVRYYFLPVSRNVNLLADASYGFGSAKADGESDGFNQFTIAAGPALFLSRNTALEFLLKYASAGGDAYGGDDRQNNFGLSIGFQVHLGK